MAPEKRKWRVIRDKNRWAVTGYHNRKKWYTSRWEGRIPFYTQEMAQEYANQINEDWYRCQTSDQEFDPYRWFGVKSFIEYAQEVYAIRQAGLGASTRRAWKRAFGLFEKSEDLNCALKHISYQRLEAFVLNLSKTTDLQLGSILDHLKVVAAVLQFAHKRSLISGIPVIPSRRDLKDHIKAGLFRDEKRSKRALTRQEQDLIIAHMDPWHRPIAKMGCHLGCRPGELRALRWEDVDWLKKGIWIRRALNEAQQIVKVKTDVTVRMLPLSSGIIEMLQDLAQKCKVKDIKGHPHSWIFLNRRGRPYSHNFSRFWTPAVKAAGLPHIDFRNGTRHSKATQLANEGWPIQKVQAWMGHSSYATTDAHYIQSQFLDLREMV